ncbi:MAG: DUF4139 domain-containing protein [Ignavibacteria bacterium]|nr:DUF4139 domain-containing protein [Ignavibacteria bacterium]
MKKYMVFILLLLAFTISYGSNEIVIKPTLSGAKVFLRGAELTHTAKLNLTKGINEVVLSGIAANIDRNSINVSAKGDAVIISVVQRFDYLRTVDKAPMIKILEDSLETLNFNSLSKKNEIDVFASEIDMILANKEIGSKDKGVSVSELQKMAEFFRKRMSELKSNILSLQIDIKKIEKQSERIKKQLAELNNNSTKTVNEVVVTLQAKNITSSEISLSYIIYDAGWNPIYDIRVDQIGKPANLFYKANINQNSGFDWNDINVVLSTRNPSLNNNKPELYTWYLDFLRMEMNERVGMQKLALPSLAAKEAADKAESMADYFMVEQKQLSAEFSPTLKYSIPSDGKPHTVSIQELSLPAKYEYYAVPKLDNNAFLVAYLSNWEDYNLLPGQTNIYFENSYVGQSYIDPFIAKDTLAISLGRDQNISVKRNTLKDFTEDKFLSSDVERFYGYEIVVKNNKNLSIDILVEDQIPISKNEDITVKMIDYSQGNYSISSGKITWKLKVEPTKSQSKKLLFSVRYPKDKPIMGL